MRKALSPRLNPESAQLLRTRAAAFGAALEASRADALVSYVAELLRKNEEINLTAVRDLPTALVRHAVDSFAFALHVRDEGAPPRRLLDLGTGGGFPGVPVAALYPEAFVVLLDGTRKKLDVVRDLLAASGLANAEPRWARAEDLLRNPPPKFVGEFDAVLARAVGPLAELVARGGPFVRRGGALVCWKSPTTTPEEIAAGRSAAKAAGFTPLPDLPYESDRPSTLVRYRRTR